MRKQEKHMNTRDWTVESKDASMILENIHAHVFQMGILKRFAREKTKTAKVSLRSKLKTDKAFDER